MSKKEQEQVKEEELQQEETQTEAQNAEVESQNAEEEQPAKEETPEDKIAALQAELEKSQKEYLFLMAEFDNYRKRTLKEKADLILQGGEKTIKEILPVLDDFERAMADKSEDPAAIKEGMQLIFNKFQKTLESLGVKKIETENADFDVDFHESIALVPGMGEDKKGKVIDCVQTGYTLNDKVIRFAKVAVGQ